MTCKDCLSYELCSNRAYQEAQFSGKDKKTLITIAHRIPCKFFKNKADFVEVVRCNMRDRMIELVDKAKEEYFNDVTDHTETEYIVEWLLNYSIVLANPTEKGGVQE